MIVFYNVHILNWIRDNEKMSKRLKRERDRQTTYRNRHREIERQRERIKCL